MRKTLFLAKELANLALNCTVAQLPPPLFPQLRCERPRMSVDASAAYGRTRLTRGRRQRRRRHTGVDTQNVGNRSRVSFKKKFFGEGSPFPKTEIKVIGQMGVKLLLAVVVRNFKKRFFAVILRGKTKVVQPVFLRKILQAPQFRFFAAYM